MCTYASSRTMHVENIRVRAQRCNLRATMGEVDDVSERWNVKRGSQSFLRVSIVIFLYEFRS